MTQILDFSPWLRDVIKEAQPIGLAEEADALEEQAFAVYTTSSEWFGEASLAIVTFRHQTQGRLSANMEAKLEE